MLLAQKASWLGLPLRLPVVPVEPLKIDENSKNEPESWKRICSQSLTACLCHCQKTGLPYSYFLKLDCAAVRTKEEPPIKISGILMLICS